MVGCASLAFATLWLSGDNSVLGQQQKEFRVSTLTSGWGYYSAAFGSDGRHLAVVASKGSRGGDGLEIIEEIQIWDLRDSKLVSERLLSPKKSSPNVPYHATALYGYTPSGAIILLGRDSLLLLLDPRTFDEIREINLATGDWPGASPHSFSFVKGVAVDKNGDRAAVLLQWGVGGGGELRVYDLNSGQLIRSWDYHSLRKTNDRNSDFGGADISADGRQVAVSVIPFVLGEGVLRSSDRNVFVLDVDSGSTVAALNTSYPAGDVRFAPTAPPVLLTVSADNYDKRRSPKDAIKVWDPVGGKLLRELAIAGAGVHFQVQVSSDGKIVLGYTGAERFEGHWWLGQEQNGFVAYDQFTLWDLTSGNIVASSPRFEPAESHRNFLLSPIGNAALLYPDTAGGETLSFYERQQTP
jgi:WD40 repeat protein